MKITEVKTYNLSYPLIEPFANARSWSKARHAGIVEIRTDAGRYRLGRRYKYTLASYN